METYPQAATLDQDSLSMEAKAHDPRGRPRPDAAIDKRAARVSRIDSRIGLNKIFKGVNAQSITPQGRNNTLGHRLAYAKRIPNR